MESPLAEGRELKLLYNAVSTQRSVSPLAEGRELKYNLPVIDIFDITVAPRGGA